MTDWIVLAMRGAPLLLSAFFAFEVWRSLRTGVASFSGNRSKSGVNRVSAPRAFWLLVSFHGLMFSVGIMLISDLWFGVDLRFWL